MIELLWVGIGGFIGAILRYALSTWAQSLHSSPFPAGTLVVNGLGCFAMGVVIAFSDRGSLSPQARLFLTAGLLGALTTFSTFSWDTLSLIRNGSPGLAVSNILGNVLVGLLAVTAGHYIGRSFF